MEDERMDSLETYVLKQISTLVNHVDDAEETLSYVKEWLLTLRMGND